MPCCALIPNLSDKTECCCVLMLDLSLIDWDALLCQTKWDVATVECSLSPAVSAVQHVFDITCSFAPRIDAY